MAEHVGFIGCQAPLDATTIRKCRAAVCRSTLYPATRSNKTRPRLNHFRNILIAQASNQDQIDAKGKLKKLLKDPELDDKGIFIVDEDFEEQLNSAIRDLEQYVGIRLPLSDHGFGVLNGKWVLRYTTLQILGTKRVKLGLGKGGLVRIENLYQIIDKEHSTALNQVEFNVLGMVNGFFSIRAKYEVDTSVESLSRVLVETESATLTPKKLQELLGENFDLLLSIFRPDGHLDITYLDETLRIGRDSRGHLYVLEKVDEP